VETTDLESAVDSILQDPDVKSDETNPSETAGIEVEPTDDGQSDAPEEAAESEDVVEASNDADTGEELDVEIDDDDLAEPSETTNLIPVKIDGKEERWTLDQLKQSAAGQGYINKRMQEVAALEKQYKQQFQALAQQQQQALELYQRAEEGGLIAPAPPSKEDFTADPIGYMEKKFEFDEVKAQYDRDVAALQQTQRQQSAQEQQQEQAYLADQAEQLKRLIPEIAHPEKGAQLRQQLIDTGVEYGFSPEEIQGVKDSRHVLALNDARKYRQLVAKKKAAKKEKGETLQPVRAGAKKRPENAAATNRKKAQQRLQKSGRIEDAIDLIMNS
jgi:hypothetical protein